MDGGIADHEGTHRLRRNDRGVGRAGRCEGPASGKDVLEIELRLFGVLGTGGETTLPALMLDLTLTGEQWERVWGVHSNGRNPGVYIGRVRQADRLRRDGD